MFQIDSNFGIWKLAERKEQGDEVVRREKGTTRRREIFVPISQAVYAHLLRDADQRFYHELIRTNIWLLARYILYYKNSSSKRVSDSISDKNNSSTANYDRVEGISKNRVETRKTRRNLADSI